MSVIIATRMPDGRVLVAADSRASMGGEYEKLDSETSKLWQRDDDLIMGSVGRLSDGQALRYDDNFIPTKDLRDLDTKYLVNLHIYIVNRLMDFHGYEGPIGGKLTERADDNFCENSFLIAYGGRAWKLEPDGCVTHLSEDEDGDAFLIMGSGEPYASSYLSAHLKDAKTAEDTKKIVTEAIKQASKRTWTIDDNVIMFESDPIYSVDLTLTEIEQLKLNADSSSNDRGGENSDPDDKSSATATDEVCPSVEKHKPQKNQKNKKRKPKAGPKTVSNKREESSNSDNDNDKGDA